MFEYKFYSKEILYLDVLIVFWYPLKEPLHFRDTV